LYETEFEQKFKEDFKKLLDTITTDTSPFIHMLNNVLGTKYDSSYYTDQSTLEALLTLRMKIYLLSSTMERHSANIGKHHYNIMQVILNEMNEIQRSLVFNCLHFIIDGSSSHFYGYYIQNSYQKRLLRTDFLNSVTYSIGLTVGTVSECSLSQILLEVFIPQSEENSTDFKRNIFATNVSITDDASSTEKTVTIENIYNHIKTTYDSEAIFVYQDSVIATIMKIISKQVLECSRISNFDIYSILSEIKEMYNIISFDVTNFPKYLVDGFTIWYKIYYNYGDLGLDELQHFHDSLTAIKLPENTETKPFEKIAYLKTILKEVTNAIVSLQCFQESYRSLHDKHQKYYVPFINSKKALFQNYSVKDNQHSKHVCKFAINIYSLCFQAKMFNQNVKDKFYSGIEGNDKLKIRFVSALKNLRHYFLLLIKKGLEDERLLKMAYTIAPILANAMARTYFNHWEVNNALHLVMVDMNSIGLQYCQTSKGNFLLFNKINFFEMGNKKLIDKAMNEFYKYSVNNFEESDLNVTSIDMKEFEYFHVNYLYENFIKNSSTVRIYENIIKFYWDGQTQSIRYIYEDSQKSLKNSHNFYALFDLYFKFFVAAVYYEIKVVYESNNLNEINFKAAEIIGNCTFAKYTFPRALHSLIGDVNDFMNLLSKRGTERNNEIPVLREKVGDQLKKFSIVFNKPKKNVRAHFCSKCLQPSTNDTNLVDRCNRLKEELSEYANKYRDLLNNINL